MKVRRPDPVVSAPRSGLGSWTKRAVETALVAAGACRRARRRHGREASILAYHNIIPDDLGPVGDSSLHLPRSAFAAQLERLSQTHRVVSLRAVLDPETVRDEEIRMEVRGESGEHDGRPLAAITFDDAYRGALTHGLEELRARRMPATVFVAPGLLGDRETWWDLLSKPGSGGPSSSVRARALGEARGLQEEVLALAGASGEPARLPESARIVTESELLDVTSRHELDLGSHTWSHANLTRLDETEIEREYARSHDWLAERFACFVPWVAYPYGLSVATAERIAAKAYRGGLRLGGGYTSVPPASGDRYRVPRINIPSGVSLQGFELRASAVIRR